MKSYALLASFRMKTSSILIWVPSLRALKVKKRRRKSRLRRKKTMTKKMKRKTKMRRKMKMTMTKTEDGRQASEVGLHVSSGLTRNRRKNPRRLQKQFSHLKTNARSAVVLLPLISPTNTVSRPFSVVCARQKSPKPCVFCIPRLRNSPILSFTRSTTRRCKHPWL